MFLPWKGKRYLVVLIFFQRTFNLNMFHIWLFLVRQQWLVFEDGALAHNEQEKECELP